MVEYSRQERIVLDFIGAYGKSWPPDLARALEPLAEDATYQVVVPTTAPIRGRDNILKAHQRMKQDVRDQKHDMKAFGSHGNTVFTERVDYSLRNDDWTPVPLVAVFDLDDAGRIVAWREYLDLAHAARQHGITAEALLQSIARLG